MSKVMKRFSRTSSGQGMAEGVAGLVIFCFVFVGCLMLFLNTVVLSDYYRKLQMAATEAAKSIDSQRYWLGSPRPDYDQGKAEQNAHDLADFILTSSGLPKSSNFSVDYPQKPSNIPGQSALQLTRVTVTVNQLRTVGHLFTPFVALSGTGISSNTGLGIFAYANLAEYVDGGGAGIGRQVYVPIYGATCGIAPAFDALKHAGGPGSCPLVAPTWCANMTMHTMYPDLPTYVLHIPDGTSATWHREAR
ncbi:MAG: hypothetical protein JO151_06890 [Verrucomicrobia bacterium]|nr:hypothetical protein [Verrucomicrobiota bacterium]